jgi:hypothetical protein
MRTIVRLIACVGIALTAAGCDPVTERRYFTEGAGVDLYTADSAKQIELQNQYVDFVCAQAGSDCGGSWTAFVQAGMNDVDLRCDGFLTWLDARRRDKEPVLAEISAVNAAAHTVMTVSGATPKSLEIVTAAFQLATQTYINWNSRLLLAVNQSTVQEIVYNGQGQFRDKIKNYVVPDRPTAIYLLRNYLRLCMPTTIEANINVTSTLVQRGNGVAAEQSTVVKTTTTSPKPAAVRIRSTFSSDVATKALGSWLRPGGVLDTERLKSINDFLVEKQLNPKPLVSEFLKTDKYAAERVELARRLNLVP